MLSATHVPPKNIPTCSFCGVAAHCYEGATARICLSCAGHVVDNFT